MDGIRPLEPSLSPTRAEFRALKRALSPAYRVYIDEVSGYGWPASIETCAFLWHLCRTLEADAILELGSGFTSYVFRRYAHEADYEVEVVSADNDVHWLDQTRAFLARFDVDGGGLIEFDDLYSVIGTRRFAVVFNDIIGTIREEVMPTAVELRSPNGAIVLDDAQRDSHRAALARLVHGAGMQMYDVRRWSYDKLGRWALLAM